MGNNRAAVWWGVGTLLTSPSDSPFSTFEFKMGEREVLMTIAQRVVIKFLTNENVGPNEIWRRLRAQYGESTLSKTQMKFWHKQFRGGRDAVQNKSSMTPKDKHHPREHRSGS